jgi:hypothetical protein
MTFEYVQQNVSTGEVSGSETMTPEEAARLNKFAGFATVQSACPRIVRQFFIRRS